MIDPVTIWQIEEKTEAAFVAYLSDQLEDYNVHVDSGMSAAEYREPGVYVVVDQTTNVSEQHGFNGYREANCSLTIRTHAELDRDQTFKTSAQQHAELKSRVMHSLAQSDLVSKLNAETDGTVAIDRATIEGLSRGMNTEENYHENIITVVVNIRPVDTTEPEPED